jgi:hypothetical protein
MAITLLSSRAPVSSPGSISPSDLSEAECICNELQRFGRFSATVMHTDAWLAAAGSRSRDLLIVPPLAQRDNIVLDTVISQPSSLAALHPGMPQMNMVRRAIGKGKVKVVFLSKAKAMLLTATATPLAAATTLSGVLPPGAKAFVTLNCGAVAIERGRLLARPWLRVPLLPDDFDPDQPTTSQKGAFIAGALSAGWQNGSNIDAMLIRAQANEAAARMAGSQPHQMTKDRVERLAVDLPRMNAGLLDAELGGESRIARFLRGLLRRHPARSLIS